MRSRLSIAALVLLSCARAEPQRAALPVAHATATHEEAAQVLAVATDATAATAPTAPTAPGAAATWTRADAGAPDAKIATIDAGADARRRDVARDAPACDPKRVGPDLRLEAATPVENGRNYKIAGTGVSVCVVQARYPYDGERHRLWAMVDLRTAKDQASFDLDTETYASWGGVRIEVGIVEESFVGETRVWVFAARAKP
jgi:hypothetical protein